MDQWAVEKVAGIRRAVRAHHPDPSDAIPLEVMRLNNEIRITCDAGGHNSTRTRSTFGRRLRLYLEHITEADEPKLIQC